MNPKQLYSLNIERDEYAATSAFQCASCNRPHLKRLDADACCVCPHCHLPVEGQHGVVQHPQCQQQAELEQYTAQIEQSQKVETCGGPVFLSPLALVQSGNYPLDDPIPNGGIFEGVRELCDWAKECSITLPDYVPICIKFPMPPLRFEDIQQRIVDAGFEALLPRLQGVDSLKSALDTFNQANASLYQYVQHRHVVVRTTLPLTEEEKVNLAAELTRMAESVRGRGMEQVERALMEARLNLFNQASPVELSELEVEENGVESANEAKWSEIQTALDSAMEEPEGKEPTPDSTEIAEGSRVRITKNNPIVQGRVGTIIKLSQGASCRWAIVKFLADEDCASFKETDLELCDSSAEDRLPSKPAPALKPKVQPKPTEKKAKATKQPKAGRLTTEERSKRVREGVERKAKELGLSVEQYYANMVLKRKKGTTPEPENPPTEEPQPELVPEQTTSEPEVVSVVSEPKVEIQPEPELVVAEEEEISAPESEPEWGDPPPAFQPSVALEPKRTLTTRGPVWAVGTEVLCRKGKTLLHQRRDDQLAPGTVVHVVEERFDADGYQSCRVQRLEGDWYGPATGGGWWISSKELEVAK